MPRKMRVQHPRAIYHARKGERIIAEELRKLKCGNAELTAQRKGDPQKLAVAARLRKETTLMG